MAVQLPALSQTLSRATRRVRALQALGHGATGLLVGALFAGVLLVLMRTRVLENLPAETLALPPLLGLLAGALFALLRPLSALDVARLTEQRLDLKERFSTALALAPTADAENPLVARQIADAEAHAVRGRELSAALPLTPPKRAWAALAALLAVFLAWFLPTLPYFQSPRERTERAQVKREGERLVRVAKTMERDAQARKLAQTQVAAKKLAKLGEQMKRNSLTKQKAMMKAAKLTQEMKQAQQALAGANSPKSLQAAGREMQKAMAAAQAAQKESGKPGQNANAEGAAKNPKNAGAKTPPQQQAVQKAQQALAGADMQSLAEQLNRLSQMAEQGQPGDKAGQKKLGEQMSALSKALKGTPLDKASDPLEKAAEALQRGDMQEAAKQLAEAAKRVQEAEKKSQDAQGMQQAQQALAEGQQGMSQEGETPGDGGEGESENDAFGKDGKAKEHDHQHSADCTKPGGT